VIAPSHALIAAELDASKHSRRAGGRFGRGECHCVVGCWGSRRCVHGGATRQAGCRASCGATLLVSERRWLTACLGQNRRRNPKRLIVVRVPRFPTDVPTCLVPTRPDTPLLVAVSRSPGKSFFDFRNPHENPFFRPAIASPFKCPD
jgi:hypothetical protein